MTKASPKSRRQILGVISVARAEQILYEWVNTVAFMTATRDRPRAGALTDNIEDEDAKGWGRLFQRLPEIPSVAVDSIVPISEANWRRLHQQMKMAITVGEYLRKAWDAPDLRKFDWYTWAAQSEYEYVAASVKHGVQPLEAVMEHGEGGTVVRRSVEDRAKIEAALRESGEPAAVITPVEAAIFYLRHNRDIALHCPNPVCRAP